MKWKHNKMAISIIPPLVFLLILYFLLSSRSEKRWTTKKDFETGILTNLLVPEGLSRLELKRKNLFGTAVYIYDVGLGKIANWKDFGYFKEDTKIILRDQFQENSLSEYYIESPAYPFPVSIPSWNPVNKRIEFDTGDNQGLTLRPKNVNVHSFVLSFNFLGQHSYPTNFAFLATPVWVNHRNMYILIIDYSYHSFYGSPRLAKISNGSAIVSPDKENTYYSLNTQYHFIMTVNEHRVNLKIPGLIFWSNIDRIPHNIGPTKFGTHQGKGWIDNFLLEHYNLPSPAGTDILFRFSASSDKINWGTEYTNIEDVPNSRYIKIELTMTRENLTKAMPVLNNMILKFSLRR